MLSDRTNTAGASVSRSLPFRILVLGDFSGGGAQSASGKLRGALDARPIRSFDRSRGEATLDAVMFAMNPWVDLAVDGPEQQSFEGTLSISEIEVDLGRAPKDGPGYRVSGVARFISTPDQTGSTKIDVTDLVVSGDLTLKLTGADPDWTACAATLTVTGIVADSTPSTCGSTGRLAGLVEASILLPAGKLVSGKLHGSDGLGPSKRFRVLFGTGSETTPPPPFEGTIRATRILTFSSLQGFSPDAIAAADPELRRLQLIGGCMGELQASIRNHPPLRNAMKAFLDASNSAHVERVRAWARTTFSLFALDLGTATPAAPSPPIDDALRPFRALLATPDDQHALDAGPSPGAPLVHALMTRASTSGPIAFEGRDQDTSDYVRFVNALAALLVNTSEAVDSAQPDGGGAIVLAGYKGLFDACAEVSRRVEARTKKKIDMTLHDPKLRSLESNWRGLADLVGCVSQDDVIIDLLDVSRAELDADLRDHDQDIFGSALFQRVYDEYDRHGGRPYAAMIGLYEYSHDEDDLSHLKSLQRICGSAHCPYISAVNSRFFNRSSMAEVAEVTDLDAVMNHPEMSRWNELRDSEWSSYIGLTLPRYLLRRPWDRDDTNLLWGNAAILFAKNMVRSYERSGWAQHVRGPRGGGAVDGLQTLTFTRPDGSAVVVDPVEISVPDYREDQFARNGLIPLVQAKAGPRATFFSCQSIKRPKDLLEEPDPTHAQLVTNLAYTFSVTIIAHYVKAMMREFVGSTADAAFIQREVSSWLARYVTTVVNPDDLTLRDHPFQATDVKVEPKPGPFGWYTATISARPHQQFEGMDVELRLEVKSCSR